MTESSNPQAIRPLPLGDRRGDLLERLGDPLAARATVEVCLYSLFLSVSPYSNDCRKSVRTSVSTETYSIREDEF